MKAYNDFRRDLSIGGVIVIRDVTPENLGDIPSFGEKGFCRSCLYWESPEDFNNRFDPERKKEFVRKKREWFLQTLREFGNCGKIVYYKEVPVGYAQYAPASLLPNVSSYKSGPVGTREDGVAFLSCLYLGDEAPRGRGIGTKLLNSIIADLRRRGFRALETFARRGSANNPSGPVEFYLKNGFYIKDETDPEFPRVRLDLLER